MWCNLPRNTAFFLLVRIRLIWWLIRHSSWGKGGRMRKEEPCWTSFECISRDQETSRISSFQCDQNIWREKGSLFPYVPIVVRELHLIAANVEGRSDSQWRSISTAYPRYFVLHCCGGTLSWLDFCASFLLCWGFSVACRKSQFVITWCSEWLLPLCY